MKTPFIKNKIVMTTKDHPGLMAGVIYTNTLDCNLNCLNCYNKKPRKRGFSFYNKEDLYEELQDLRQMTEMLIICGGEPTLHTNEILDFLSEFRKENFLIRLDTNGQRPEDVVKFLPYIDGVGLDIKIDAWKKVLNTEDNQKILGIQNVKGYVENLMKTINIIKDLPYTIFRTVKYPSLIERNFDSIRKNIEVYDKPYYVNDFVTL